MGTLNWNTDSLRCSQCGQELMPSNLENATGTLGEFTVTCRHLPCIACPQNHESVATSPDFGETLLDTLFSPAGIPKAKHKGLLRKVSLCPNCGHELPSATGPSLFRTALALRQPGVKYEVEFEILDARHSSGEDPCVFTVELECPAHTCMFCGTAVAVHGAEITSPVRQALYLALGSKLKGMD